MNKVTRFESAILLATVLADRILQRSGEAINQNGKFMMAISGGKTPASLYKLLATEPYRTGICWENVFIFWVDERCVPAESKDNNSYSAKQLFLDHISIPTENIFPIPVDLSPADAAATYEQTIKVFFKEDLPRFDLVLLGMGDDGHTASLFPNTPVLLEQQALVKEVYVEKLKMWRITFTAPLINHAKEILFMVTGKEKAAMLKTVLYGKYEPAKYPAQFVKNAAWFIAP
ncbi:MAG: 6-phosphogluconolactonase [Ferruginibacter sp.]